MFLPHPSSARSTPPTRNVSRRSFLRAAGAGAAAALAGPFGIAGQDDKSGKKPLVVGSGECTYEVEHDWGRLPGRIRFGNTHGVAEDSQGRIYVKHTVHASSQSGDAIVVFDESGEFVRSWGEEFRGGAHGLHLQREGRDEFLYLADPQRGLVVKTDLAGNQVWRIGCPMESGLYNDAKEYRPTNVAVAPNGDFFVADGYGKSWIHRYNAKAEYLGSFGGPGAERGQVSCPHGLIVDTRGDKPVLLVADRSNRRLQRFTLDGRSLGFSGEHVRSPCHFHTRGRLLLIPDLEARVTILDGENKLVTHLCDGENFALRDKPREQFVAGRFIAPHSAIFDHAGNIFVVEWVEVGRVTKLRRVS